MKEWASIHAIEKALVEKLALTQTKFMKSFNSPLEIDPLEKPFPLFLTSKPIFDPHQLRSHVLK